MKKRALLFVAAWGIWLASAYGQTYTNSAKAIMLYPGSVADLKGAVMTNGVFYGSASGLTNVNATYISGTLTNSISGNAATASTATTAATALSALGMQNVLAYGAKGDGTNSESSSIQNAINAGNTTYIPLGEHGVYLIDTTLAIPSNHKIIIEKGVVLKAGPLLNAPMISNSDTSSGNVNIEIQGGTLDGNLQYQSAITIPISFTKVGNSVLDRLTVTNSKVYIYGTDYGAINLNTCTNIDVMNVNVTESDLIGLYAVNGQKIRVVGGSYVNNDNSGIDITTAPYSSVHYTKATDNGASGISLNGTHNAAVGNSVSGNQWGINVGHTGNSAWSGAYSTVAGNTVYSNWFSGIQTQTGDTVGVQVIGNAVSGNGATNAIPYDYILPAATLGSVYYNSKIGIGTTDPNADLQFGIHTQTYPASTSIGILAGKSIRFTSGAGNAQYGGYIKSDGEQLQFGYRSVTDHDYLSITNGAIYLGNSTDGYVKHTVTTGIAQTWPSTATQLGSIVYSQDGSDWIALGCPQSGDRAKYGEIISKNGMTFYPNNTGTPKLILNGTDAELPMNLYVQQKVLTITGTSGSVSQSVYDGELLIKPTFTGKNGVILYDADVNNWLAFGTPKTGTLYDGYGTITAKDGFAIFDTATNTAAALSFYLKNATFGGNIDASSGTVKAFQYQDPNAIMTLKYDTGLTSLNTTYSPGADVETLALQTGGTSKISITRDGNVGIGTTTPYSGYKLDVAGHIRLSGSTPQITGNSGLKIFGSTASSYGMELTTAGKLGVKKTPSVDLDVDGEINASGAIRATTFGTATRDGLSTTIDVSNVNGTTNRMVYAGGILISNIVNFHD